MALGLEASPDLTRKEWDEYYRFSVAPTWNGPPTARQIELAEQWGLAIDAEGRRYDAFETLRDFLLCRAWVFSVIRHFARPHLPEPWRVHPFDAVHLPEMNGIASELLADIECYRFITSAPELDSSDQDVWFRMTKKAQKSAAFRFVAKRLVVQPP
ncbi:MAG TPA: hypothetical protein VHB77_20145 [Planctomycetaceae bacterium]|nr:hypothetical protein [Planctomycetaceae bacterium]